MIVGIVDDDTRLAEMLSENLEQESHFTSDPSEMLSWVQNEEVDCVVTDLKMEPMGGLELLDSIRDENSSIPVILMTGHGSVDSAVEAMKKGARDYLQKPVSSEEFQIVIDRIEEEIQKRKQLEGFRVNQQERSSGESLLIGDSSSMKELRDLIKKVAGERLGVLIQGETGTGKELVAREIHALSNRGDAPFMTVNCAAIPENLLESELFGHEKGAFTGADERRKGKMELADGGTLFLDEIGELPLDLQPKLLRSLEQEEFTRVGGEFPQQVDVRFISATNRDLEKKIEEEDFRKDLYYRLNTLEIHTPPLRDHPEDIPMLVDHFLHNLAIERQQAPDEQPSFSEEALTSMKDYDWPGNVRELKNVVERAAVLTSGKQINVEVLPDEIRDSSEVSVTTSSWTQYGDTLPSALEQIEQIIIEEAISEADSKAEAARELGISRQALQYKLEQDQE